MEEIILGLPMLPHIQLVPKDVAKILVCILVEHHKCITWEPAQANRVVFLPITTKVRLSLARNGSTDF